MECKYCNVIMELGLSIRGFEGLSIVPRAPYTWNTLDIVKCWKCPECGHSEYLDNE